MKFICLTLLSVCLLLIPAKAQDDVKSYTKTGQEMPSFKITDVDGRQINIADLKGKVVYVNFWATWCPPCLEEMPRVEKEVWQKYKSSENFVMTAIAREQTEDEITPFKNKYKYTFPMASDPSREIYNLFGDGGIPRSYVVGTDGKILFQSVGYDPSEFSRMVKIIGAALDKTANEKQSK